MDERRKDYPIIIETLADIKTEVIDARLEVKRIATLVEERNNAAVTWRTDVCKKFDKIFGWLEELPCKEREGLTASTNARIQIIMWAVGIIFVILGSTLWWTVTDRSGLTKDIAQIKYEVGQMNK